MAHDNITDIPTYLFMDALELRLRVSSAGSQFEKFRHLRGTALRLLIERPPAWEYLLFTETLFDGVNGLIDLKRDWQYQLAIGGISTVLSPLGLKDHFEGKLSEARRIANNAAIVINQAWAAAIGKPGEPAEADAILYAAGRLTSVYRHVLEWKLDFQRVVVPAEMNRLMLLTSCVCDNIVSEIEEFSRFLKTATPDAVRAARAGEKAEVRRTLTLTVPDMTEAYAELRRVAELISSGGLN